MTIQRTIFTVVLNEVKTWKIELGDAKKKHIKLQKKFDILQSDSFAGDALDESFKDNYEDVSCYSANVCTIYGMKIPDYVPEYFCGMIVNPSCKTCQDNANLLISDQSLDPFSSFPAYGMPSSLVSHWIPTNFHLNRLFQSLSLTAHYVLLSKPTFVCMEEIMQEFERRMDKRCQELQESCRLH